MVSNKQPLSLGKAKSQELLSSHPSLVLSFLLVFLNAAKSVGATEGLVLKTQIQHLPSTYRVY